MLDFETMMDGIKEVFKTPHFSIMEFSSMIDDLPEFCGSDWEAKFRQFIEDMYAIGMRRLELTDGHITFRVFEKNDESRMVCKIFATK